MFGGDASFTQVPSAPGGRTYVLKFQSSDQRHFVSFQVTWGRGSIFIDLWIVLDAGTLSLDRLCWQIVIAFVDLRMHLRNVTPSLSET